VTAAVLLQEPAVALDNERATQDEGWAVDADASRVPDPPARVVELPVQRAAGAVRVERDSREPDRSAGAQPDVDEPDRRQAAGAESSRAERFSEVYEVCWPTTVRFIERQLRRADRDCAEDLAQATFLQAWRYVDHLPAGDEAARRYVRVIARHVVADHYGRPAGRQRAAEWAAAPEAPLWGSSRAAVDDATAAVDARVDLAAARSTLDAETAEVLRLRFAEDLELRDVARRIGRGRATTVRRQAEGLAELREQLTGHGSGRRSEQRRAHHPPAATSEVDRAEVDPALAAGTLAEYGAARIPRALRGLAEGTADPYLAGWRQRVLPALGDRPVGSITGAEVEEAVRSWVADDCGRATIRNTRAVLRRVLEQAVRDGVLQRNPATDRAAGPASSFHTHRGVVDTPADTGAGSGEVQADPLARASRAVTQVHRARLALERRGGKRGRAEQLVRWHADDHGDEHAAGDRDGLGAVAR